MGSTNLNGCSWKVERKQSIYIYFNFNQNILLDLISMESIRFLQPVFTITKGALNLDRDV